MQEERDQKEEDRAIEHQAKQFDREQDQEFRERKRVEDAAQKQEDDNKKVGNIAPALKAGSVEAYKYMLSQKDKAGQVAEKQLVITTEALEIGKRQLSALENFQQLEAVA